MDSLHLIQPPVEKPDKACGARVNNRLCLKAGENSTMPLTHRDLQRFVAENEIDAEIMLLPDPTPTVESAAAALGVTPPQIVKSLLFRVNGVYRLVIAAGTRPVRHRHLARHFGTGRRKVHLASREQVESVTGYEVGTVPPFGHPEALPTIVDQTVMEQEVVYGGGGAHNGMLRIRVQELLRVVGSETAGLTADA